MACYKKDVLAESFVMPVVTTEKCHQFVAVKCAAAEEPAEEPGSYEEFASGLCGPRHFLGLASGRRSSLEACATTCKVTSECGFMAFCPSGGACPGGHSNRCALYSRCDVLDSRPEHAGYTTYKVGPDPAGTFMLQEDARALIEPGSYKEFVRTLRS